MSKASSVRPVSPSANGTAPPMSSGPNWTPNSYEAEQAALGTILVEPELLTDIRAFLKPGDFYYLRHEWIYTAMLAVCGRNEPVDVLTVSEELRRTGQLVTIPNAEFYLRTELMGMAQGAYNGVVYAHIVERAAYRRRLISLATDVAKLAYDEERDTIAIINEVDQQWKTIRDGLNLGGLESLSDVASAVYDTVIEGTASYVPSGYADLDEHLSGGFQAGCAYVLAGRPGMGKTTLMLNIARNVAFRQARPVIIFSFEMTKEQLVKWLIAGQMKFPASDFWKIKRGDDEGLQKRFVDALDWVSRLPIYIVDTSNTTPPQMISYINSVQRRHGQAGIVMVDHINRARTGVEKLDYSDNSYGRVSLLALEYKNVAKDTHVPMLYLAQLNRAVEQRNDKHPMLSDLRESGRVEEEADVVFGLYREGYYKPEVADTMTTEVATLKNREGPPGKVCLQALFTHSRFYNTLWKGSNPAGINWPLEEKLDNLGGAP